MSKQNKNKNKVIILSTNDYGGGAARAAYRIHKAIEKIGVQSTMLVKAKMLNEENILPFFNKIHSSAISNRVYKLYYKLKNRLKKRHWRYTSILKNRYFSDWGLYSPKHITKKLTADIVLLQWISGNYIDMSKLHTINKPIIWTLHDANPITGGCHIFYDCENFHKNCGNCPALKERNPKDLTYKIHKKKLKSFKKSNIHVVATCNWMANCVKQSSLLGHCNVSVIPNSIDTEFYKPQTKEESNKQLNLNPDKYLVMYGAVNATTDENKGFDLLIASLNLLPNEVTQNLEVLVFGLNTSNDNLKNTHKSIVLKGSLPNDELMVDAYNMADLVVVPSRSENLSLVIMESLSCGTPVLAFNIGGNPDMIDHNKNGFLAAAYDPAELAHGIEWGLENRGNIKVQELARNKVLTNYTSDIVATKYEELFKSLV